MAQTSVAQFSADLKMPANAMLELLQRAGVIKNAASDLLTERDKSRLLEYLRRYQGKPTARTVVLKKRILVRRDLSELRTDPLAGMSATKSTVKKAAPNDSRTVVRAFSAKTDEYQTIRKNEVDVFGAGKTPCSCMGTNANCFKCSGRGYIDDPSTGGALPRRPAKAKQAPVKQRVNSDPWPTDSYAQCVLGRVNPLTLTKARTKKKASATHGLAVNSRNKNAPNRSSTVAPNSEALMAKSEQIVDDRKTERQNDATKDYWSLRDSGQFGSCPSHDDYDN